MRLSVYLSDDLAEALDRFAGGRSRSAAVRDAVLLAVNLVPIKQQLDRIEMRMTQLERSHRGTAPAMSPSVRASAVEALQRTVAAEPAGFIDDDE